VRIGAPLESKRRRIAGKFVHPTYTNETWYDHIVLLKLDVSQFYSSSFFFCLLRLVNQRSFLKKPVEYSEFIVPVCLPSEEYVDYDRMKAEATSFKPNSGDYVDEFNLTKSTKELTMRGDEQCENRIKSLSFVSDLKICWFDDQFDLSRHGHSVRDSARFFCSFFFQPICFEFFVLLIF
jgi:hypothetical protein